MPPVTGRAALPDRPPLRGPLMLGLAAAALFFGGLGAWAAMAPLASAAHAPGVVRVESHRKTIQHLEGGIIRDILVRDGDVVAAGEVLVRLDRTLPAANLDSLNGEVLALSAREARLKAERDGADTVPPPPGLTGVLDLGGLVEILDGQQRILDSRRASFAGRAEILRQQIVQLHAEGEAYKAQLAAVRDQAALLAEEARVVRNLIGKGLERRPRLMALEREKARVEGLAGEYQAMIARNEMAAGETRLKIDDLGNERRKEIEAELRQVQTERAMVAERLRAAIDVASRTEIRAPVAGRVVELRHVTAGGVIGPGDPVLDLVPLDDAFVVEARLSPLDIELVHPGLDAEVKLTAFRQRRLPVLVGTVRSVSADALTDPRTGAAYYAAEVSLPAESLAEVGDGSLYPGMPADVLVLTGDRTALQYFTDPIRDSFRRAFRED